MPRAAIDAGNVDQVLTIDQLIAFFNHKGEYMKERSKILIVDDRHENIFSLKQLLLETDAEVISASNGNEALTATLNHDFVRGDSRCPDA